LLLLKTPILALNLKTYSEAMGHKGLELCRIAERVSTETGAQIIIAPQHLDIRRVTETVSLPVFAQHVDPFQPGSWTGAIIAQALKEAGASGSIINHSEKRLKLADISMCVQRLREVGLMSLLCTNDHRVSAAGAALEPDIIAVEPPELIGTGIPVSKARPEVVTASVRDVRRISDRVKVICGAGISSADDVAAAISLGSEGVLLASAFVLSKDPLRLLSGMAEAAVKAADASR